MPVELTAKGYIEIYEGDTLVSRHRQEREALERLSELPFGFYTVRYPNVMSRVYGVIAPADSGDVIPPSQVTGLTATVTSATTLTLDWDAASDDVGVGAYQIYQDGVPLVSTANLTYGAETVAQLHLLSPETILDNRESWLEQWNSKVVQ